MKMDKVANSNNDEYYTPLYAIEPILKYIPTTVSKLGGGVQTYGSVVSF